MADMVDKQLFEELAKRDPNELILPPFCNYNEADKCYNISVWGGQYEVYPDSAKVEMVQGAAKPHDYFYVFLINYLLLEKKGESIGEWISVKDLPGGVTFFRGPHEIPTHLITTLFGDDLPSLRGRCEELGGKVLDLADCSYAFEIIGAVKVAVLYWQGDEDFPAEGSILVDKSMADMPLDVVYALLCEACVRLGGSS